MNATDHLAARDAFVARLHDVLRTDDRFVAAWLAGSLGRGDADAWSDVDLWLVVADDQRDGLCDRPNGFSATLSPARSALVSQFGTLAVEGENSLNAGPDGVAMNVVYRYPLLVVDWYLVPVVSARRPTATRVLFDHQGIPISTGEPSPADERAQLAAVEVAMFWYFVVTTMKAIRRQDALQVQIMLRYMRQCAWKAERLALGEPVDFVRQRDVQLVITEAEQITALREACSHMLRVMPLVAAIGGAVPQDPTGWVEQLLD